MSAVPSLALAPGWTAALEARLDQAPASDRRPLVCPHRNHAPSVIGSIDVPLARRMIAAGLPLSEVDGTWHIDAHRRAALDAALHRMACWLRDNGLGGKWRDEALAVTDAEGRMLAVVERAAVRALGIATRAVHLVGRTAHGDVWIQQRAFDKAVDPGLRDTMMGGLVSADESIADTLARETWEEAGLDIGALRHVAPFGRFTVRRPVPDGYMVEHIEMFEAEVPADMVPVNQDGEVAGFECLPAAELARRLEAHEFTLEAAAILWRWSRRGAI